MSKISKIKFNIFFLILALGLVFIASFLGTSLIKAQGQIKIVPTSFSGDWQNPEAVFIQDLGESATFEEFNIENSAYPLIISSIQKTTTTETTPVPEEIISEATTTEATSTEEVTTTTKTFASAFILSDFSVTEEFKQNKINNVQLRLSLAGKGKIGDKLIIDYYYQDSWQNLAEFNLGNEISNHFNGGYFLFGLPIFKDWEELENLKIRFTVVSSGETNVSHSLVYLDAAWLEVEYGETVSLREERSMFPESATPLVNFFSQTVWPGNKSSVWRGSKLIMKNFKIINIPQFNFVIPEDGRIIATVNNPNQMTEGIFRIHFYSNNGNLVSVLDVASGEFIEQGHEIPWPRPEDLTYSLLPWAKEQNTIELNVKKEWGKIRINVEYIPLSGPRLPGTPEEIDFDILELKFEPRPISLGGAKFLTEMVSGPKERNETEVSFENFSLAELIVDVAKAKEGGGGYFFYLDGKGIGLVENWYDDNRIIISKISPGKHTLVIKHGDCFWDDNEGERKIKVYLKEVK